jgi:hypothetical protein
MLKLNLKKSPALVGELEAQEPTREETTISSPPSFWFISSAMFG